MNDAREILSPKQLTNFDLLFNEVQLPVGFESEKHLEDCLLDGNGIYWDLEFDGTTITRVVPYSMEQVVENLHNKDDDTFYDFNRRLGE